jgi:DNA-directed RNA polymerase subunit L
LKIIKENHYNISNDLVSDISLFIDDMRLLFNIINEYHIYSNSIDSNLDQDKLLSMIVYKNMHPIDFINLSNNKGSLYETLSKKQFYIQEQSKKVDLKIDTINEKIKEVEDAKLSDIKELRTIYLSKIVENIIQTNPSHPFFKFWIDNRIVNLTQATEEENFNAIIDSTRLQYTYNHNQQYRQNFNLNFNSI